MPYPAITKNFTGKRFGRLVAKRFYTQQGMKKRHWICDCDCGAQVVVTAHKLQYGNTRSCGCLRKDTTAKINRKRAGKICYSEIARLNGIKRETLYYHINLGRSVKDALERIKLRKPLAS